MFKRCKVVMLPTKNEAKHKDIIKAISGSTPLTKEGNLATCEWVGEEVSKRVKWETQHLYILSDDEIKEGDWYIDDCDQIRQSVTSDKDYWSRRPDYKKIIATTDSLVIKDIDTTYKRIREYLPSPSQSFIDKYVFEYNKGNIITDVMVEYDEYSGCVACGRIDIENCLPRYHHRCNIQHFNDLKVNPKDNTITIKKVKDSWTRDEVIALLKKEYIVLEEIFNSKPLDTFLFDKWIEDNI